MPEEEVGRETCKLADSAGVTGQDRGGLILQEKRPEWNPKKGASGAMGGLSFFVRPTVSVERGGVEEGCSVQAGR